MESRPAAGRRAFLAGTAGALAATGGCVRELRNLAGRQRTRQLSLSVATLPTDADPYAVRVAGHLAANLELAGIDVVVDPMGPDEMLRQVLVNNAFDLYVGRYPSEGDPDELRSLLHSNYGEEAGWQNPFGFANLAVDDLLDEQRVAPREARREVVADIQRRVVEEQPFTVVGFADRIAGVRTDTVAGWPDGGPAVPADYLGLEAADDADLLRVLLTDERVTRNRNPIAVEHRDRGSVTGLLYDPLVRVVDGEPVPWLARTVEWVDDHDLEPAVAEVRLREATWHDGRPVSPSDVAFTYAFLGDTSLGRLDTPVPTPWRRGRVSLVADVEVRSETTLRVEFDTPERAVARRGLSVPVLPEHVWSTHTDPADVAGIEVAGGTTEALVWPNEEPVGSGPLRFVEATPDERLVLERFEDHFLERGDADGVPDRYAGGLAVDRVAFEVVPTHGAAVQLLADGDADATADGVQASVASRIARSDDVTLSVTRADAFYHVGYNCRRAPMSNPRFRQVLARHLDRGHLVTDSFGGYADASEVPLRAPWAPEDLRWDGTASQAFLGAGGELDVEAARRAFREAGYQYRDEKLVRRGEA